MTENEVKEHKASHPWKVRLIVMLVILGLSFIGLVVSSISETGAWNYWRIMVPVYACLSLFLSFYLRGKKHHFSGLEVWHEILHWVALILAVYLTSLFVHVGIMGRFEASLVILTLLSLTTFLAGVYIDPTFIIIGALLGFFCAGAAFVTAYLYPVMILLTLLAGGVIFYMVYKKRHHKE